MNELRQLESRLVRAVAGLRRPGLALLVFATLVALPALREATATEEANLEPDPPVRCSMCDAWNLPRAPFPVFGNTYFVGTEGLSSVLIATPAGLVLIDVALPQSAPKIDANVRALGFKTADIKFILTSHAHFDHVGGVRSMQRLTGATVLASAATARALALGHPVPEDPQFGTGPLHAFPALANGVRVMQDGETFSLGGTQVTIHYTPGHTPGATTWSWTSCAGARCLNMVYADSLTAVSNDGYRFTDAPGLVEIYRATLRKVSGLPCDIVLSTHPTATGMDEKVAARAAQSIAPGAAGDPFVDPKACAALAERSGQALDERLARERAAAPPTKAPPQTSPPRPELRDP
jgi:metallo-beta-lactamase class B